MDDFRPGVPRGYQDPYRRRRPEDWALDLLRRISLRTWLIIGAVLAVLLALAVWALVALWQAIGEQAPGWQEKVGGLVSEVAPVANPAAITEPGAAIVSGVVGEATQQVGQYAAELDRVVPGASVRLKSAAQGLLGEGAAVEAGEAEAGAGAAEAEAPEAP